MKDLSNLLFANLAAGNRIAAQGYAGQDALRKEIAKLKAENQSLRGAIEEALEFVENQYDVVDGDYGFPAPNKAMQLGSMLKWALGERP